MIATDHDWVKDEVEQLYGEDTPENRQKYHKRERRMRLRRKFKPRPPVIGWIILSFMAYQSWKIAQAMPELLDALKGIE